MPVLYSFRRCPYAIRGRMALAAAGIRCEIREVLLSDKPGSMLEISTRGTVPVLQLADGKVIDESLDLMYWALAQADPEHWLNAPGEPTQQLIDYNDSIFKAGLDRYKYHVRYPQYPQAWYRQQAEPFLVELERRLRENRGGGLVDRSMALADIAIFPFVRQFSRVDIDWFTNSPYEGLQAWLAQLEASALFRVVMKKYPRWQQDRKAVYFPG